MNLIDALSLADSFIKKHFSTHQLISIILKPDKKIIEVNYDTGFLMVKICTVTIIDGRIMEFQTLPMEFKN